MLFLMNNKPLNPPLAVNKWSLQEYVKLPSYDLDLMNYPGSVSPQMKIQYTITMYYLTIDCLCAHAFAKGITENQLNLEAPEKEE